MFDPVLVHEFLRRSTQRNPEKTALIVGDERLTYADLDRLSDHLALKLIQNGLKRHDRVLIFLDNSIETVVALFGALKAGGVFVIVHGALKGPKLKYIFNDSGAKVLISHKNKLGVVSEAFDGFSAEKKMLLVGEKTDLPAIFKSSTLIWSEMITADMDIDPDTFPRIIDSDLATLIYTSGSTGEPKGVITSHHNMVTAARSIIQYIQNEPDDIIIDALPLSFDYGLYQLIMCVMFGGTLVLEQTFMFPVKILQRIEKEKVTGFPIVPTIVAFLLNMSSIEKYDLSSLRYMSNTGAALPVEHIKKLNTLLPHVRMFSMYGLTECKRTAYLPPDQLEIRPDSVGKAMPNCEVFIVNDQGEFLPPGEIGELAIRGSNVMRGYWNSAELTRNTYRDGVVPGEKLLYSGDLFRMDEEGYLYFVGRKDDMIKTKGERVSPKEIENIICQIDGVADAAVIGIPDKLIGKAVMAFIVSNQQNDLADKDILKYCSTNMEIFMVPKYIEFVEELPRTPNGKIDKKLLVAEYGDYEERS